MALVATVGAANANSYVSLADATAYFAAGAHLLASTWSGLASDQVREALLQTATRQLDRLRYWGCPANPDQALAFPREGQCWDPLVIPKEIKEATLEQAISLAPSASAGGQTLRERLQAQGVQSYTLGELSERFDDSRISQQASASPEAQLCQVARTLLTGFVCRMGRVNAGRRLS